MILSKKRKRIKARKVMRKLLGQERSQSRNIRWFIAMKVNSVSL